MPAVQIQFVFLQKTAAGRRKIAEAKQEELVGSDRASMLALMTKAPRQPFPRYSNLTNMLPAT